MVNMMTRARIDLAFPASQQPRLSVVHPPLLSTMDARALAFPKAPRKLATRNLYREPTATPALSLIRRPILGPFEPAIHHPLAGLHPEPARYLDKAAW